MYDSTHTFFHRLTKVFKLKDFNMQNQIKFPCNALVTHPMQFTTHLSFMEILCMLKSKKQTIYISEIRGSNYSSNLKPSTM